MNLVSAIAKNTIYQIIGKFFSVIIGLIVVAMMTRYLGQTGYGYYTTIVAFPQFFGVLIDFGLQMATTQMISKPGADEQKIFHNVFTLRLISSVVFLGAASLIVWIVPYPSIIKYGVGIASLSFLFISLQAVLISVYQKKLNMARVAMAEVWGRLVLLLGVWLVIGAGLGLLPIIVAVVAGSLTGLIVLFSGAQKYFKIKLSLEKEIVKKIWSTTWPLGITIALTLVYFRADTLIMSFMRPANEVGIYGATYKVLEILIQMPYLFLGLVLPLMTKFFIINRQLFQVVIQKSFDFLMILVVPMVIGSIILGEKIMVFVAGDQFIVSGELLRVLIFAVGIIFIAALFGYAIVAAELQKKMIKFYALDAVISIPLYLIFIPIYSYWAAAYLTVLTELIILISSYYVLKKHGGVSIQAKIFGKTLLASIIMALPLIALINLNVIILAIIAIIVYFWALFMLRGISKKNLLEIINMRKDNL